MLCLTIHLIIHTLSFVKNIPNIIALSSATDVQTGTSVRPATSAWAVTGGGLHQGLLSPRGGAERVAAAEQEPVY